VSYVIKTAGFPNPALTKMGKRLYIEAALRKKEGVLVFPLYTLSLSFPPTL
jgi:hypothetical protein